MSNYAMVLLGNVIDVLFNQETEPYYPPDPDGNPVKAVPCDETVTTGMVYNPETGEFSEYTPEEPAPEPTPEPTQLDRIESALAILTADSVTTESIEAAIMEGVNEA